MKLDHSESDGAKGFRELWAEVVSHHGGLPAIQSEREIQTFQEWNDSAQAVAEKLMSHKSWRVGIRLEMEVSRPGFFSEILGVWLAGGVPVPIRKSLVGPDSPLSRLALAITEGAVGADDFNCGAPIPGEEGWHAVYFTSGSTGEPKAVVRGWRQAMHEAICYAELLGLSPGLHCAMLVDPMFGASTKHFLGCLLSGCCQSFGKNALRQGHVLYGTPGQISAFAEEGNGRFEWISMTGESCSPRAWRAAAQLAAEGGRILNALGGSEFGVAANQTNPSSSVSPGAFCGVPLRDKKLEVCNEAGEALPTGETGLLRVLSGKLAEGYLAVGNHGLQLEKFPEAAGGRFFKTGDVGWLDDDGCFHLLGRAGKMQKRGARWINTSPLHRLLEFCPSLHEFVVDWPAGFLRPLVWCGLQDATESGLEAVSTKILESGLDERIVPAELRGVHRLPRNRHGKIDLAALALKTKTEESGMATLKIPSRVSQVAGALLRGDAHSPVFRQAESLSALGLDSLAMHELAAVLSEGLGRSIPIAMLLADAPLATLMERLRGDFSPAISVLASDRTNPLLLWFGDGLATLAAAGPRDWELMGFDYETTMEDPIWKSGQGIHRLAEFLVDSHRGDIGHRPVFTGGFSFGALLAHEAGVVLKRRHAEVAGVFLVDPPSLSARAIRTGWRWSRWRPWIWITLLAPIRGTGLAFFRRRLAKEIRMRGREWRRDWMRGYSASSSAIETILFSSQENLEGSLALFGAACVRLENIRLTAQRHLDVVNKAQSVAEWTTIVRKRVTLVVKESEPSSE